MRPSFDKLQRRVDEIEAELASLRRQLSSGGGGVRREFVAVSPDPSQPGYSLLHLNDGSAIAVADQRLTPLAGVRVSGSA
jgi:hypothetical protein